MATILTNAGLSKLSSATPLDQVNITDFAVGDGNQTVLDPASTALANEVWRGQASTPIRDPDDASILIFETVIEPSVGGFTIREMGLFDDAGDLIAIGSTTEIEKPVATSEQAISLTVRMHIKLSNTDQAELVYNGGPGYMDHSGLGNRDALDAHPELVRKLSSMADLDEIDTGILQDGQQFSVNDGGLVRKFAWNELQGDFDELAYVETVNPRYQSFPVTKWAANSGLSIGHKPCSEYDPISNRTYLVWSGPGWAPHILFYDHGGQYFSESVKIDDYPIATNDGHGKPTMVIDNDGYLHVFYGSHATDQYYAKSNSPRDISLWTSRALTELPEMTYPSPCLHPSTGDIYILFRAGTWHGSTYPAHEFAGLARSADGGDSWSDVGPIIDTTGFPGSFSDAYVIGALIEHNDKLYMTWIVSDGDSHDDVRKNVYVAYYDPSDGTVRSVDGADLGSSVDYSDHPACEVRSADNTNYPDIAITASGDIFCCWTESLPSNENSAIYTALWNGSVWDVADTGIRCSVFFNQAQLRVDDNAGEVELFSVRSTDNVADASGPGNGDGSSALKKGGDIVVYKSPIDQLDFQFIQQVISRSECSGMGWRNPSVPRNSVSGLKAFYATTSLSNTVYDCPIYAVTDDARDPLRIADMLARLPQPRVEHINAGSAGHAYNSDIDDGGVLPESYRVVDLSNIAPDNVTSVIMAVVVDWTSVGAGPESYYIFQARQADSEDSNHVSISRVYYETSVYQNVADIVEIPLSYDGRIDIKIGNTSQLSGARLRLAVRGWRYH